MNHDRVKSLVTLADCLSGETYEKDPTEKSQSKFIGMTRTRSKKCSLFDHCKYRFVQMSLDDDDSRGSSSWKLGDETY